MSSDRMAARDGAMVESTGTKQTFGSDDDSEPAAKKAKTAPVEDEDSE